MRQILFDTETTGMNKNGGNVATGHQIIEIGCVELINRIPTSNYFHCYLRPDRLVEEEATKVHGITNQFLEDKPRFADIIDNFWVYLEGADELIAHNMPFDQAFFNEELRLLGRNTTLEKQFKLVDTLEIARRKYPGMRNNLDALCKRYNVDNRHRELHGALLDAQLLAEVYLRMTGGQSNLKLAETVKPKVQVAKKQEKIALSKFQFLSIEPSETEKSEHQRILSSIQK